MCTSRPVIKTLQALRKVSEKKGVRVGGGGGTVTVYLEKIGGLYLSHFCHFY